MQIPSFLAHLPVFARMPIPFTAFINGDGKPDFRVIDQAKAVECYQRKLCATCGKEMFSYYFIGGPKSIESGMFTDGPMHKVCAEFSASLCPFLNGKRTDHNERPVIHGDEENIITNTHVPTQRPHRMAIRRAHKYVIGKMADTENIVYQVTEWWSGPKWF